MARFTYIRLGILQLLPLLANFHLENLLHLRFHLLHFVIVLTLLLFQLRQRVPRKIQADVN